MSIDLEPSWLKVLAPEFEQEYMLKLKKYLKEEKDAGQIIYPRGKDIFNAFRKTPFTELKVVILGQDPYHGPNQAHGLSFSVQKGVAIPPSLRNMYKGLEADIPGFKMPAHGDLSEWAGQGVLLLNATLTVRAGVAASHQKQGWEKFTDIVIQKISTEKEGIIFLLWGNYAQAKAVFIDEKKHHILKCIHPSPLSVRGSLWNCPHFSKTNELLIKEGKTPIDWQIH